MRLWTLHPMYLDRQGFVGLWREALLAQKVLAGKTRGYLHHPQLLRFRQTIDPMGAIALYLWHVLEEGKARGYHLSAEKIGNINPTIRINVGYPQIQFEILHLSKKRLQRSYKSAVELPSQEEIRLHPMFIIDRARNEVEPWEKLSTKD